MSSMEEDVQALKGLRANVGQTSDAVRQMEGRLREAIKNGASTGDWISDFIIVWGCGAAKEARLRKIAEDVRSNTGQLILKVYESRHTGEVTGDLVPPRERVDSVIELGCLNVGDLQIEYTSALMGSDWKLLLPSSLVATALHGFYALGWIRRSESQALTVKRKEGIFHREDENFAPRGHWQEHFGWMTVFHPDDSHECNLYIGDEAVAAYIEKCWQPKAYRPNSSAICCLARLASLIGDPLDRTPALAQLRDAAHEVEIRGFDRTIAIFRNSPRKPDDVRTLKHRLAWMDRLGLREHPLVQEANRLIIEKEEAP